MVSACPFTKGFRWRKRCSAFGLAWVQSIFPQLARDSTASHCSGPVQHGRKAHRRWSTITNPFQHLGLERGRRHFRLFINSIFPRIAISDFFSNNIPERVATEASIHTVTRISNRAVSSGPFACPELGTSNIPTAIPSFCTRPSPHNLRCPSALGIILAYSVLLHHLNHPLFLAPHVYL